jgi:hypothetical protein
MVVLSGKKVKLLAFCVEKTAGLENIAQKYAHHT